MGWPLRKEGLGPTLGGIFNKKFDIKMFETSQLYYVWQYDTNDYDMNFRY